MRFSNLFTAVLILSSSGFVDAFPSGAGNCGPGTSAILAPGSSHGSNSQVGTTGESLEANGFVLTINGQPMMASTDITVGEEAEIRLETDQTEGLFFRGFLMRLDSNNMMQSTIGLLTPASDTAQVSSLCENVNSVGGLTHKDKTDKTSAVGKLLVDAEVMGMTLDVTVVVMNSNSMAQSEWYFSTFTINAMVAPSPAPSSMTPAPTNETMVMPTNDTMVTPTNDTMVTPTNETMVTDAPTEAPTPLPTDAATAPPTVATTPAPMAATTPAPTAATTPAPVAATTPAPTAATTPAPVAATTPAPTAAAPTSSATTTLSLISVGTLIVLGLCSSL